ncbi:MAG: universal stress protein [Bryobacterales bacterium]|nr:universal stress protein [Bryobacterales bacterium]
MIRRILLPLDLTQPCEVALQYGTRLAASMGARLHLLHVAADSLQGRPRSWPEGFEHAWTDTPAPKTVLPGNPPHAIASHARAIGADMILMPTRGHGWIRQLLRGSNTKELLSLTRVPVWVAPPRIVRDMESVRHRRLLCGIGPGPQGEAVLQFASRCATAWDAQLLVVHTVAGSDEGMLGVAGSRADAPVELDSAAARRRLEPLVSLLPVQAQVQVRHGAVAAVLHEEARRWHADAIVVGSGHGSGASRPGPNTLDVIGHAPCPVIACSTLPERKPIPAHTVRVRIEDEPHAYATGTVLSPALTLSGRGRNG